MHAYRTHTCGQLRHSNVGSTVRLSGWIHNRRDLGGLLFLDLRDHYGVTQLLVPNDAAFVEAIGRLPKETVIRVDGAVVARGEKNVNKEMPTGEVEIIVSGYEILGGMQGSEEFEGRLPFSVFPEDDVPEETRLKFRFLDLRRSKHSPAHDRSRLPRIFNADFDQQQS
jgi:aspartyl-tRNA synthetase